MNAAVDKRHVFDHPIRSVAVIGAGPSGLPVARHLAETGLHVRVFERQEAAGGIWNWQPTIAPPLAIPSPPPSTAAFAPTFTASTALDVVSRIEDPDQRQKSLFSPPNPVYWTLSNNVPTDTMAFKDFPYPPGTAMNISHTAIAEYLRQYTKAFNLNRRTSYSTRVERVAKVIVGGERKWRLTLRQVRELNGTTLEEKYWTEDFDAVTVATGHYNAPYIPPIPGLEGWGQKWPSTILHSQGYRTPEPYQGGTVLIVGTGTSGLDIARDLSPHVEKIYMVGKNVIEGPEGYQQMRKMQRRWVPANGEAVPEISRFVDPSSVGDLEQGVIELSDGRFIKGITHIIFATGYRYSYPFLRQLHRDPESPSIVPSDELLITDGQNVHNLYRDVFYNPDPTLSFLGLSVNTSAFSFFEYQGISIARVFSGQAWLPDGQSRLEAYASHVQAMGIGRFTHFLGKEGERRYVRETVEWINRDAAESGAALIEGHTKEWLAASDAIGDLIAAKYGGGSEKIKDAAQAKDPIGTCNTTSSPLAVVGRLIEVTV